MQEDLRRWGLRIVAKGEEWLANVSGGCGKRCGVCSFVGLLLGVVGLYLGCSTNMFGV